MREDFTRSPDFFLKIDDGEEGIEVEGVEREEEAVDAVGVCFVALLSKVVVLLAAVGVVRTSVDRVDDDGFFFNSAVEEKLLEGKVLEGPEEEEGVDGAIAIASTAFFSSS